MRHQVHIRAMRLKAWITQRWKSVAIIGAVCVFLSLAWMAFLEDILFWSQSTDQLEETLERKLAGKSAASVLLFLGEHHVKNCQVSVGYDYIACRKRILKNDLWSLFGMVEYSLECEFSGGKLTDITVTEEFYGP